MMTPESRKAMEDLKYEMAGELGVNLKSGYKGNLSARENGSVGGNMVRKMVQDYERRHQDQSRDL